MTIYDISIYKFFMQQTHAMFVEIVIKEEVWNYIYYKGKIYD